MSISIRELRLSMIWMKALSAQSPVSALEDAGAFKAEFEQARDAASGSLWSPPWKFGREQTFWEYYLYKYRDSPTRRADKIVDKHVAWENFLPLRLRALGKIKPAGSAPAWVSAAPAYIEGYRYPHAVAVVVGVTIREAQGIEVEKMVDRASLLRGADKWFEAAGIGGGGGQTSPLTLTELAFKALDELGATAFGAGASGLQTNNHASPFTIATIIDAAGADPFTPPDAINEPAYGDFYRALDGLCGGSPDWRKFKPSGQDMKLKDVTVPKPPSDPTPPGHVVRAAGSGRAVWFPKYFVKHQDNGRTRPILGSYHRRLTLLSLQVEGLITFLQRNQGFLKSGKLPAELVDRTRWACTVLGQLYGAKGTYRSYSAKAQIETRASFVNSIRKSLKMRDLY